MNSNITAEAILKKYRPNFFDENDGYECDMVVEAMQEYASQQTEALTDQIKDLERDNAEYRTVYDSVVSRRDELSQENKQLREILNLWQKQNNYLKRHGIVDFDEVSELTKKTLK